MAKAQQPALTREMFDLFRKTGERASYETPMRARGERLGVFTLAEGIENRGKYLPLIERELQAVLEEPTWASPAHQRSRIGWEKSYDNIDLAAATRAFALATIDYLLGDSLQPHLRQRIRDEVQARIFTPYLERIRSGDTGDFRWMISTANWNAVCNGSTLGAALLLVDDKKERAEFVAAFEALAPYYLSGFDDDGYCIESIGYWNYGVGHFILAAEIARLNTDGASDVLAWPKVDKVAAFGRRWEIVRNIYPAFGDVTLTANAAPWMLAFADYHYNDKLPDAAAMRSIDGQRLLQHRDIYLAPFVLRLVEQLRGAEGNRNSPDGNEAHGDNRHGGELYASSALRDWFPSGGAYIGRPAIAGKGLAVAVKGGHNGQPHNHNDLGSFAVVLDGQLLLSDPGTDVYVRDTFDPKKRYRSEIINSWGHPVPFVGEKMQRTGSAAVARTLGTGFTDKTDFWQVDLASAYDVPQVESLTRTFIYHRDDGGKLEIIDHVRFSEPTHFGNALILDSKKNTFEVINDDTENVTGKAGDVSSGDAFAVALPDSEGALSALPAQELRLRIHRGKQALDVHVRARSLENASLVLSEAGLRGIVSDAPSRAQRLGLDFNAPVREAVIHIIITPAR